MEVKIKRPVTGFVQVKNSVLWNRELSWEAKGMYAYIFSKPPGYQFSSERIALEGTCCSKTVKKILVELVSRGYLTRHKSPTGRVIYHILLQPSKAKSSKKDTKKGLTTPKGRIVTETNCHSDKCSPISNTDNIIILNNNNNNTSEVEKTKKTDINTQIAEVIEIWKAFNANVHYGDIHQRDATRILIGLHGVETIKLVSGIIIESQRLSEDYTPSVTTPAELNRKIIKVMQWYKRKIEENNPKRKQEIYNLDNL